MHGKAVELFLVDGDANGLIIAELSNWNGKAFKLLRQDIPSCDEEELSGVGVYFLFGTAEGSGLPSVYIGESEDVKTRLVQHIRDAGAEARGFRSKGGFTVVRGSVVSDHLIPSFKTQCKSSYLLRRTLEENGTISGRKFTRDHEFGSPSGASAVILGRSSNGHEDWKDKAKKRLGEHLGTI